MAGARFANYMRPLIDALRQLGNSGTPSEVRETIAKNLKLTDKKREEQNKSGVGLRSKKVSGPQSKKSIEFLEICASA